MKRYDGSVAVVTGASSGIGRRVALDLAARGAVVVGMARREDLLHRLEDELRSTSPESGASVCDVSDTAAFTDELACIEREHGRIDVLVNNAGLGGTENIVDMTDEQWNVVLDVTLNGTFRCTRAALRLMQSARSGVIVNNASVLGWRAQVGQAHYAAAKAGVMALTRTAAVESAPYGVRVNAVSPSLAMHPFLSKVISEETLGQLEQQEAFGRSAEPWEVGNVVVFLASDYSSYMTGEIVSVSSQHP